MENEGRIARSWRLTKTAWDLVRRDRAMIALAGRHNSADWVDALSSGWLREDRG